MSRGRNPWWGRIARGLILIVWGAFLWGALARTGGVGGDRTPREERPPPPTVSPSLEAEAGVEWDGLYYRGTKIGYSRTRRTKEGTDLRIEERSYMKVHVLGEDREVTTSGEARLDADRTLTGFRFWLKSGPNTMDLSGTVSKGKLLLTVLSGGQTRRQEIEVPGGALHLPIDLADWLSTRPLRKGARFSVPFFDPTTLAEAPMEVEVLSEEGPPGGGGGGRAYKIREDFHGMETFSWVTPEGGVLREESPQTGFSSRRESKREAMTKGWPAGGEAPDLIASTAVPVVEGKDLLARARSLEWMKVVLLDVDPTGLPLGGGRQTVLGPNVRVERERLPSPPVPLAGLASDPALAPERAETPFLQTSDPEIRRRARAIAGGVGDAVEVTRRLNAWVEGALRPAATVAMPTASEVLRSRVGDCKSHAVLFVALARSLGLPARVAAGVVYLPQGEAGEGFFYYHAWAEVYLGRWISVDPTFGQFPADATHLRLVERGVEDWYDLLQVIGRLRIQVLGAG